MYQSTRYHIFTSWHHSQNIIFHDHVFQQKMYAIDIEELHCKCIAVYWKSFFGEIFCCQVLLSSSFFISVNFMVYEAQNNFILQN